MKYGNKECPECGQVVSANALAQSSHKKKHLREKLRALKLKTGDRVIREHLAVAVVEEVHDTVVRIYILSGSMMGHTRSVSAEFLSLPQYPAPTCPMAGEPIRLGHLKRGGRDVQCPFCGWLAPYRQGDPPERLVNFSQHGEASDRHPLHRARD